MVTVMTKAELREQLMKLPSEERLALGEELVASVYAITPAQEAELERRIKEYRKNPNGAIPAEEVHEQIDALLEQ